MEYSTCRAYRSYCLFKAYCVRHLTSSDQTRILYGLVVRHICSIYRRISSVKRTLLSWFSSVFVRHKLNTRLHHFVKAHVIQFHKACTVYTDCNNGGTVGTTDIGRCRNYHVPVMSIAVLCCRVKCSPVYGPKMPL